MQCGANKQREMAVITCYMLSYVIKFYQLDREKGTKIDRKQNIFVLIRYGSPLGNPFLAFRHIYYILQITHIRTSKSSLQQPQIAGDVIVPSTENNINLPNGSTTTSTDKSPIQASLTSSHTSFPCFLQQQIYNILLYSLNLNNSGVE